MRKRIYLHIGLHKTGTTSIQWALTHSRNVLRSLGWLYPVTGTPEWAPYGQHMLPWSVFQKPTYLPMVQGKSLEFQNGHRDALWAALFDEIENAGSKNIIVSSEEFDVLSQKEILKVVERLRDYDVYVIIFFRNQADFLESSYRTSLIYSRYTDDIFKFSENQRTRLDYLQFIQDWTKLLPIERVSIVDYDDTIVRQDSVGTFFQLLGIAPELLPREALQRQNESLPAFSCEILRFLSLEGFPASQFAKVVEQLTALPLDIKTSGQYTFLPPALRKELQSASDQEFARMYADPIIGPRLPASIGAIKRPNERNVISNVTDALLALIRSLRPKE